jgi:hypothetical protein
MITSIKGGASSCASTNPLPPAPGDTKAESPQPNCGVNNSASKPASQKYKSVMTVSFPK